MAHGDVATSDATLCLCMYVCVFLVILRTTESLWYHAIFWRLMSS